MGKNTPLDKLVPKILEDLVFLGKHEQKFDVFGHEVVIGTLWNKDERKILIKASGLDMIAKDRFITDETVIEAIQAIDGVDYSAPEEKVNLRALVDDAAPQVVSYIYQCYRQVVDFSNAEMTGRIEELKKKSNNPLRGEESGESSKG